MKRKLFLIAAVILVFVLGTIKYMSEFKSVTVFSMDTVMTVKVTGSSKNLKFAESEIKRLDRIFNGYDKLSELYGINENAGGKMSAEMADIITRSEEYWKKTDGCFDITLKNLKDLWDIKSTNPKVPENNDILKSLETTGMENVEISGDNIVLENGVKLDLGGIAKGYATDILVNGLKEKNVSKFILDLGGNVYGYSKGKPLNIGIQNPFGIRGDVLLTLEISDEAVVSSGTYERNFEVGGKIYHHILDPKNGYPADSGIEQVTVIGKNASLCDAYSTAILVMGDKKAKKLYENSGEFEYIIVKNNKIFASRNLEDRIKNVNEEFEVIIY